MGNRVNGGGSRRTTLWGSQFPSQMEDGQDSQAHEEKGD